MSCDYCGAASLHAVRSQKAPTPEDLARDEAEIHAAQAAITKRGTTAFLWSMAGLVVCCLPVPGIVAITMAHGVRTKAQARGWLPPSTAVAAIVLGIINILIFSGFVALVAWEMRATAERQAFLHETTAKSSTALVLPQAAACDLAELRLLEDGWKGHSGNTTLSETFDCAGRLEITDRTAVLYGLTFRFNSDARHTLDACLRRGQRWRVEKLVSAGDGCGATNVEQAP